MNMVNLLCSRYHLAEPITRMIFSGSFKGMQMDIDRLMRQFVANNNDLPTLKNFIQSQGVRQSANEHLIPEQLFDSPDTVEKEVECVSAIKALNIAIQPKNRAVKN